MAIPRDDADHPLSRRFRQFIKDPSFPCVGAKSALSQGRVVTIVARDLAGEGDDARIHAALLGFIARYRLMPDVFQSFVVLFECAAGNEVSFERHLWSRAQALCDRDAKLGHPWDPRVADDAENPHFSMSVAGEAFFIVGLHPQASRPARRFEVPTLVFNMHAQFERLRSDGRYEKLRTAILRRDEVLAGSINPMLARHGEASEARQYSGRVVEADWRCPFRGPAAHDAGRATGAVVEMRPSRDIDAAPTPPAGRATDAAPRSAGIHADTATSAVSRPHNASASVR